MAQTYCDIAPGHPWHGPYHDTEYGFPLTDDATLFERLVLEINQAGLSWLTILKKRDAFRRAYRGFDPRVVARFGVRDTRRLMADAGIIRNRLKIEAAIANARTILTTEPVLWLIRGLAQSAPPSVQGTVGQAIQENVSVYRWGDRRRIPDEHRIFAGRSHA